MESRGRGGKTQTLFALEHYMKGGVISFAPKQFVAGHSVKTTKNCTSSTTETHSFHRKFDAIRKETIGISSMEIGFPFSDVQVLL